MEHLELIELGPEHEAPFREYLRSLNTEDTERWLFEYKAEPYSALVEKLRHWKEGKHLPNGWVPSTSLFLFRGEKIVGRSSLRHHLNDALEAYGGHIGYYIRPDQRSRGCGTAILRLTLEKARRLGLSRVLVTCDDDNLPSARIIEKNGGILQDTLQNEGQTSPTRRYWIDLTKK